MANFILSSCTIADMPVEFFHKNDIPYACLHFQLNGKDYLDDCGQSVSYKSLYEQIAAGAMPTTSQVNPGEFISLFEPYLQQQKDILHLAFSSGLSGTYNSACLARDELLEKYPDRNLLVVDTLGASAGVAMFIEMVAEMRDRGVSIQEAHQWAEDNKMKIQSWVVPADLNHLKRGGRLSATSAFVGTKLNIFPIIEVNAEGKLIPRFKVRGRKQVLAELIKIMETNADQNKDYAGKCFLGHANCYDEAKAFAELIEANFPNLKKPVIITDIGAVIGSHVGPGTLCLFYFGKKRVDI